MYTPIMEDIVRGALAGIAIGGLVAAVVEANRIALQAIGRFNYLALDISGVMAKAALEHIKWQRYWRQRQQQLAEDADNSADED